MSKLLGAQSIEGNPLQKIAQLEQRMAGAENGEVNAATLADITPHAGQLQDVSILVNEDFDDAPTEIQFDTPDGVTIAEFDAAHIASSLSGIIMKATAKTSSEGGIASMQAASRDGTSNAYINLISNGSIAYNFQAVSHQIHHGESEGYLAVTGTSETSVAYTSVPANALGINGRINFKVYMLIQNNKGSNGTATFKLYFGSKTFTLAAITITNSATTRSWAVFECEVVNLGATNAQNIWMRWAHVQNLASETQGTLNADNPIWTTGAVDTTAAVDFKLNVTLSAAHASFFVVSSGEYSGAYGTYS